MLAFKSEYAKSRAERIHLMTQLDIADIGDAFTSALSECGLFAVQRCALVNELTERAEVAYVI